MKGALRDISQHGKANDKILENEYDNSPKHRRDDQFISYMMRKTQVLFKLSFVGVLQR